EGRARPGPGGGRVRGVVVAGGVAEGGAGGGVEGVVGGVGGVGGGALPERVDGELVVARALLLGPFVPGGLGRLEFDAGLGGLGGDGVDGRDVVGPAGDEFDGEREALAVLGVDA